MSEDGMSTIELMSQPPAVRRVVRIMLRNTTQSYESIASNINELPEDKRPTPEELQEGLDRLVEMGWLIPREEDGSIIYSVKVKSKEGSEVRLGGKQDRAGKSQMDHLWGAIDTSSEAPGPEREKAMHQFQTGVVQKVTLPQPPQAQAEAESQPQPEPIAVQSAPLPAKLAAQEGLFARLFGWLRKR